MSISKWVLVVLSIVLLVATALYVQARMKLVPLDEEARQSAPGEFVALSQGQVHLQWHGSGEGPVVVLVHGFSTPSFVWVGVLPKLTEAGLRVLTYDLYGRGFSDRPDADYNAGVFERQLLELLSSQSIEEPIALVGYSIGGAIATHFTANHPARVTRLALIAPAGFPNEDGGDPALLEMPVVGDWLMQVFGRRMLLGRMSTPENQGRALPDLLERFEDQFQYEGYLRAILSTIRHFPTDAMKTEFETVGRSDLPVFAIWGRLDQTVPFANAEQLKIAVPQAEIEIVEDGTHAITYSAPDRVANALVNWFGLSGSGEQRSGSQFHPDEVDQ